MNVSVCVVCECLCVYAGILCAFMCKCVCG